MSKEASGTTEGTCTYWGFTMLDFVLKYDNALVDAVS